MQDNERERPRASAACDYDAAVAGMGHSSAHDGASGACDRGQFGCRGGSPRFSTTDPRAEPRQAGRSLAAGEVPTILCAGLASREAAAPESESFHGDGRCSAKDSGQELGSAIKSD